MNRRAATRTGRLTRGLVAVSLLLLAVPVPPVRAAEECPVPEAFAVARAALPATAAAVRRQALTIVAMGGAATLGGPAHGTDFTWPARLRVHLGERLPGVEIRVVVRAVARQASADLLARIDAQLAADKAALVIWGPGASAAGRGDDLDTFTGDLSDAIGKIRGAGADLILMTLQYAPSVARVVNLPPYRAAVIRAAETADLPVFDRYELMRFWSDNAVLDLDATDAAERTRVARKVYDCMADLLARGIADAVK